MTLPIGQGFAGSNRPTLAAPAAGVGLPFSASLLRPSRIGLALWDEPIAASFLILFLFAAAVTDMLFSCSLEVRG